MGRTEVSCKLASFALNGLICYQLLMEEQQIAFATHLACYALLVIVLIFFRWYLKRENAKRDSLAGAGVQEAKDTNFTHAFEDLTDRENPNFRYMY